MGKEIPASMGARDGTLRRMQAEGDPEETKLSRQFMEEDVERLQNISRWGLTSAHHRQASGTIHRTLV